jgi:hypothetical protein
MVTLGDIGPLVLALCVLLCRAGDAGLRIDHLLLSPSLKHRL